MMMQKEKKRLPMLRFPGFEGEWEEKRLGKLFSEFKSGNNITASQIKEVGVYPVYGGNGLRGYFDEYTHEGDYFLIGRQGALCGNINRSKGKAYFSEHAIACMANESNNTSWLSHRLEYYDLNRLSESSAQPGLSVSKLLRFKLTVPTLSEQQKIATFLTSIDTRIQQLEKKKTLLEQYKKGVMQKIFKQEIRFKTDDGKEFGKWEKRRFSDVLFEHKLKSTGNEEVHSVSVHKGVINQIEHLGRSFAAKNTDHYNRALPNDIIYTKSPTGNFPLGIIKQNHIEEDVILSPLYGVFTPETKELGYILHVYFESPINTSNYLSSIVQKGAKNTMSITNNVFLSKKLLLPVSKEEQTKIAHFLTSLDTKIAVTTEQVEQTKKWKKGLLQRMFV